MMKYLWIIFMGCIEYMLAGKNLFDYTNLVSPNDYKKNAKIMYKYFKDKFEKSRI